MATAINQSSWSRFKAVVGDMGYASLQMRESLGEATPRLASVMGPPNRAPDGPVMGGADRGPRLELMGGPDRGLRVSVMGGRDSSPRVHLFGESDAKFVDSLFTGRTYRHGDHRRSTVRQSPVAPRVGLLQGLAPSAP